MTRYCHRCKRQLVMERRWVCKSCKHGYCKDCYITYHWHTPEQDFRNKMW